MYIDIDKLQDRLYVPYSISMFKENYYVDGAGSGFWNGGGNGFYNFELLVSDYSPEYNVNCLYCEH